MDCNKEEAIRAKEIAEKKMQNSDFAGAWKIALKAQQLFSELENISQLLTVCEVHCSAQNKIVGSEMDWYGILQLERGADEATIKKQYRKLALLLHPDKNKFAGAEAAFKLIGEANRVLSDMGKRSLYDMKCRAPVRTAAPKPPPHQVNRNSFVRKQYGGQNNFPSVSKPQFTGLNPHQQTQTGFHNGRETFWTCCPFCSMRYQYYRDIVNRNLRCQNCDKPFIAYDLGVQGVPSGSNWSQPVFAHHRGVPSPAAFQVGSDSTGGNPPCGMGFQSNFPNTTAGPELVSKAGSSAEFVGGSKSKGKEYGPVDVEGGKQGARMRKPDAAKRRESGTSGNTRRKRGRKMVVESSESSVSSSSDDTEEEVVIQENVSDYAGQNAGLNGGHHRRRSSRQKQHVSYQENLSGDDDFVSPPKRSRGGLSSASEEEIKEAARNGKTGNSADSATAVDGGKEEVKQKVSGPLEESLAKRKRKAGEGGVNGAEAATVDHSDEKSKAGERGINGAEATTVDHSDEKSKVATREIFEYPDPDFCDFDKDRLEDCFSVDQLWAIYDTVDGMPRYYARVKKVFSPGFKLRITWLEACPDDQCEFDWVNEGLPAACGKFKHGATEETTDRLTFSHQVYFEKVVKGFYVIYPRKGETWALFKNWDFRWSSNPANHMPFKFEFVEVLSDFVQDDGIGVAYLGRVKGFVSLFQQTARNGIVSFRIPSSELFRFSHRIPSFRMTGSEREGVPRGSWELDPGSLPTGLNDFGEPSDAKMQNEAMDAEANSSRSKSPENNVKPTMGSKRIETPQKHEKIDIERETSKLRRSPRESNSTPKKYSQVNANQFLTREEETNKNIDGSKDECHGNLNKSRGSDPHQADENMDTPKKHEKTDLERETAKLRRSPRELNGKKHSQVDGSQGRIQNDKHLDGSKDENHCSLTQSEGSASSSQADEVMHLNGKDRNSNSDLKNHTGPPSSSSGHGNPDTKFYNFNQNKFQEKFEPGQLWALYSDRDSLPKIYALVKKIESSPDFRLHVALLEACSPSKDVIHPVCCGTFKLRNGKAKVFCRTSFSHQLTAESIGKNRFEIYPRKGEVWALYKNWNKIELTCSDLENCEYDIVEVIEDDDHFTKVSLLVRVNGFKSVFKAPRRQRSNTGIMDILRVELPRFSHQIPAIRLTGDKDIRLRDCWELDPSSIPGIVICLD